MVDIKEFVKSDKKTDDRMNNLYGGAVLLGIALISVAVLTGIQRIAEWGGTHEIVNQRMVDMQVRLPFRIEDRKPLVVLEVKKIEVIEGLDTDIEKYICDKWGVVECRTALAIAEAESNLDCNAYNTNTDGSVDLSIFQLNSVHLKKGGEWTLENMSNCKKNVDLAYEMWLEQGWEPWSAFLNESYLTKF